jgi:hypothetical protein
MRFACWTTKARIETRAEYVTLTAFPLLQWLRERASMLRYMYIGCLVLLTQRAASVVVTIFIYVSFFPVAPTAQIGPRPPLLGGF